MHSHQCTVCTHLDVEEAQKPDGIMRCTAYPEGIPNRFVFADERHDRVVADQTGTDIFVPIKELS